ncbi:hypothetical protein BU24DRAFT_423445 [Aaosphaeria arxii CBS 175.79]|uniref:Subtilisin-like serine protease n=1 Tax=Aaosphaeria arxii CBS 175.79 TaxID=1450172 RepID=A0A6A5XNP4_9PLEO|nr:uncharacterized protein BU24DRAFT_423445 [Aaosphaeria arxii CBS 175.79]KAF2014519.1 hypothetical protein BU24DRAFT_423445 [Aaosphaeria arxii CBS 175.79]
MSPFSKKNQLVHDLDSSASSLPNTSLPGQPSILLNNFSHTKRFLEKEFCSYDLEKMAPHLWIMTTLSSANINPLHRQRVKGREIIVTEEPRLHLVWIHNRIFIKPLPRYILSQAFWEMYLDKGSNRLGDSRLDIYRAATGFLRTYRYLIQHESDFNIAQQENLRLIPKDVDWKQFSNFIADLNHIDDSTVSKRYCYGELRLTRLNFYAPFLLRKFQFEQVHGQYGAFFGRLYGPLLFLFALISIVLSAMQVALAAEQLAAVHWEMIWHVSRWFSIVSLVGAAIVSLWFAILWLWLFLDEWIYTVRRKIEKRKESRSISSC